MKTIDNINISYNPTKSQLAEIKKWLIDERKITGEGFYCNWDIIKSSYAKNKMVIISLNNMSIGFAIWNNYNDFTATIDITAIKPSHRSKGFGKQLISNLFNYFKENNIYVVDLQCAPESSEPVWRKLGFIDFPETNTNNNWNYDNTQLYKIIVPFSQITNSNDNNEIIELWNDEPYCTENTNPFWSWNLEFIEGSRNLKIPIIHPCLNDWRIRWKQNGKTVNDDKVKYLLDYDIVFSNFLIIKSMPVIK